jgi:hypothetical protein
MEQGQDRGMLYFPASPPGAQVSVDGVEAGLAGTFSGPKMLAVPPGSHRVSVRTTEGVVIDKTYYVDAGAEVAVQ